MGHYVYKYVLDDEIIYIGKCDKDLDSRLYSHGRKGDNIIETAWDDINKSDVFYMELPNSTMSDVVESELINRYKPRYNKAKMSDWSGIPFREPKWKPYKKKVRKSQKTKQRVHISEDKDYRERNANARTLINVVLQEINNGMYEVEYCKHSKEPYYKVEITNLVDNPDLFLFDTSVQCCTKNHYRGMSFFNSTSHCSNGRVYANLCINDLEEKLAEVDKIIHDEKTKFKED